MNQELAVYLMKWLNFLILAGLLFKFALKPLGSLLDRWSDECQNDMDEAMKLSDESRNSLESNRKKLEGVAERIEEFRQRTIQDIDEFRKKIEHETQREISNLEHHTEAEQLYLKEQFRLELQRECAEKAVARSGEIIKKKMTKKDRTNFNLQFIEMLKQT